MYVVKMSYFGSILAEMTDLKKGIFMRDLKDVLFVNHITDEKDWYIFSDFNDWHVRNWYIPNTDDR